jgi:hypothetical protein
MCGMESQLKCRCNADALVALATFSSLVFYPSNCPSPPPSPRSTLLAVDGTLLSPDLQPVPAGFSLSHCGRFLLRPNGKPVPRGVHVGPGFRLLKPNGEHLPDGEYAVGVVIVKRCVVYECSFWPAATAIVVLRHLGEQVWLQYVYCRHCSTHQDDSTMMACPVSFFSGSHL